MAKHLERSSSEGEKKAFHIHLLSTNYDSQRSLISLTRDYKVTDSFSYPILATDSLYKLVFDYNSSDGAILGKLWAIVAFFQGGGWLIAKELTLGHQRIVSEHQRRPISDSK